ncbi:hypothetical protein DFH09DRAFT_1104487 [Mycena vulgaris]|nr:hypothetical protein DFH09DRAFT_1104487 [Mycena vulgaris]
MPPVAGMATAVCARGTAAETAVKICPRALKGREDLSLRATAPHGKKALFGLFSFDSQNKRYMFGTSLPEALPVVIPEISLGMAKPHALLRSCPSILLLFQRRAIVRHRPPLPPFLRGAYGRSPLRLGPAYHSASTAARVLQHAPFKLHHARAATLARGWTGISLWRICLNESVGGSASRVRAVRTTHTWHPALSVHARAGSGILPGAARTSACLVRTRAARSAGTVRAHTARASGHRIHAVAMGPRSTSHAPPVTSTPCASPGAWVTPPSPKARQIRYVASLVLYGPCAQDARALAEFLTPFEPGMRWVYVHDTDAGRCGKFGRMAFADEVQRRAPWIESVRCEWFGGRVERLTRGKADGPGWVGDVLDETKMCEADIALDAARCRTGQRIDRHIQRGFFSTSSLRLFLAGFLARGTFPPAFRNVVKPRSQPEMPPISIDQKPHHQGDGGARGANGQDNGEEPVSQVLESRARRLRLAHQAGDAHEQIRIKMKGGGAGLTHQTIRGLSGKFMRRSEGVEETGERSTSINKVKCGTDRNRIEPEAARVSKCDDEAQGQRLTQTELFARCRRSENYCEHLKTGPSNEMRVQDARTKRCQEEYSNKSASQLQRGATRGNETTMARVRRGVDGRETGGTPDSDADVSEAHRLRRDGRAGGARTCVRERRGEGGRRSAQRVRHSRSRARGRVDGGGDGRAGWPCSAEGGAVVNEVADCGAAALTSSGDGGRASPFDVARVLARTNGEETTHRGLQQRRAHAIPPVRIRHPIEELLRYHDGRAGIVR